MPVGDVAREQQERDGRKELREPDKPEIERAAGQRVDLPADRDHLHLQADIGEGAHTPEQHERPVMADRGGLVDVGHRKRKPASLAGRF